MIDIFRPRHDPAKLIYDTFQEEAAKRNHHDIDFIEKERQAVWKVAVMYALANKKYVPKLKDIIDAENYAIGSIDYGAKLAYKITDIINQKE
jgi:hypothetical protein